MITIVRVTLTQLVIIAYMAAALFWTSCGTTAPAPTAMGNLGAKVNTPGNEYAPFYKEGPSLLFTSENRILGEGPNAKKISGELVLESGLIDTMFGQPSVPENLPFASTPGYGYLSISFDGSVQRKRIVVAGLKSPDIREDMDLFESTWDGQQWSPLTPLPGEINTLGWESQPALSQDGSYMVFASDRKGGQGGIDLYISSRTGAGWSKPVNVGPSINSRFDDATPFIAPDGTLYFASKRKSMGKDYDLFVARRLKTGWDSPKALPSPFSTPSDDYSPSVGGDSLFFASDRPGGVGSLDLYAFRRCGPVIVKGAVLGPLQKGARIEIRDEFGRSLAKKEIAPNGTYKIDVPAQTRLLVRYTDACAQSQKERFLQTGCSESSVLSYSVDFSVSDTMFTMFSEDFDVPFFVSGYYMPNTSANLEALRLKFLYNLIGNDPSSRYIENPGREYDDFARIVDQALISVLDFVTKRLSLQGGDCKPIEEELVFSVEGYADPRAIAGDAVYGGRDIDDPVLGMEVLKGDPMTNELLSALRAYETGRYLYDRIAELEGGARLLARSTWKVQGRGIDQSDRSSEAQKRRVGISIRKKN